MMSFWKQKKHFICQICFNFRKEFYCGCRYRYNSVQIDLKYPLQWIQKNAKYSSLKKFNCYYVKDANLLTKLWVFCFIEKKFFHQRANEAHLYDNRGNWEVVCVDKKLPKTFALRKKHSMKLIVIQRKDLTITRNNTREMGTYTHNPSSA